MDSPAPHILRFGVFELDAQAGELRRNGLKVRVPHQSLQVLQRLLSSAGNVVTREELRDVLWTSDTFVDFEVGLNSAVRKLRDALQDSAENPRFIETLPRRGYRFIASVSADSPAVVAALPPRESFAGRIIGLALLLLVSASALGHERKVNPKAHEAYSFGLMASGTQRADGFLRAVAYFEEAITLDPEFAEAHAELGFAQMQFLFGGPFSPHEVIPKAESAARRALQLNGSNARAHRTLSQILALYYWRWDDAERALERSIALQRDGADAMLMLVSQMHIRRGRLAEGLAAAERWRMLDPQSVAAQIRVGTCYRAAGQHERALHELQQAALMSPGQNRVRFQLGITYASMGRTQDAVRELELAAGPPHGHNSRMEAYLGYAYAAAGRTVDARNVLRELEEHRREQYVSWFGIALIHDALGDKDAALAAFQRAYADRAVEFALMDQYPPFRTIAGEPRYATVMRQVGLQ